MATVHRTKRRRILTAEDRAQNVELSLEQYANDPIDDTPKVKDSTTKAWASAWQSFVELVFPAFVFPRA